MQPISVCTTAAPLQHNICCRLSFQSSAVSDKLQLQLRSLGRAVILTLARLSPTSRSSCTGQKGQGFASSSITVSSFQTGNFKDSGKTLSFITKKPKQSQSAGEDFDALLKLFLCDCGSSRVGEMKHLDMFWVVKQIQRQTSWCGRHHAINHLLLCTPWS